MDQGQKPLVHIDVVSDVVCPWCYIGKRRLERAMDRYGDRLRFEVAWRPFMLNPTAPKEGVDKVQFYNDKFGPGRAAQILTTMRETFRELGLDYSMGGLTSNTLACHRLLAWAADEAGGGGGGLAKQDALADSLLSAYHCEEKHINDREVLLEAAQRAGLPADGAARVIDDESSYLDDVKQQMLDYAAGINGVPHFTVEGGGGSWRLSGAQDAEVFARLFEAAAAQQGQQQEQQELQPDKAC